MGADAYDATTLMQTQRQLSALGENGARVTSGTKRAFHARHVEGRSEARVPPTRA